MISATTSTAEATRELAAAVAGLVRGGDIVLLAGELGAGKTCFTQGFGRALGIDEVITSPTFTLLRPYQGRLRLLHGDVYRLEHLQEIIDLGISEQVDEDAVAVIEWGDVAEAVLPADFLEVRIIYGDRDSDGDTIRRFSFRVVGAAWARRVDGLRKTLAPWADTP